MTFAVTTIHAIRSKALWAIPFACWLAAPVFAADLPVVTIAGVQAQTIQWSAVDLKKLPSQHVNVLLEDGTKAEYEGVAVATVLSNLGLAMGTAIRGKRLADYLLVTARDGYRAVFALPELDPAFTDGTVLLCFARDGVPIAGDEGPFRLVVPNEKRHARWVRQVDQLAIKTEK